MRTHTMSTLYAPDTSSAGKNNSFPLFLLNVQYMLLKRDTRVNDSGLVFDFFCVNCGLLGLKWELKVL